MQEPMLNRAARFEEEPGIEKHAIYQKYAGLRMCFWKQLVVKSASFTPICEVKTGRPSPWRLLSDAFWRCEVPSTCDACKSFLRCQVQQMMTTV